MVAPDVGPEPAREEMTMTMRMMIALLGVLALTACGNSHTEGVAAATVSDPEATEAHGEAEPEGEEAAEEEAPAEEAVPEGITRLTIDAENSSLGFTGAKVTGSHDGTFGEFAGTVDFNENEVTASQVAITIQMATIEADDPRLTRHLRSDDFFDVENIPTSVFESTAIADGAEGDATHTITGNLTMHGQTHQVAFPATVEVTDEAVRARAEFSIDRQTWGISYPGMPDNLISDSVVIRFDVRAPRT